MLMGCFAFCCVWILLCLITFCLIGFFCAWVDYFCFCFVYAFGGLLYVGCVLYVYIAVIVLYLFVLRFLWYYYNFKLIECDDDCVCFEYVLLLYFVGMFTVCLGFGR